ncbi:MAG: nuclease [Chitinophagaceae bacterium]|nr:nuclease [Chitinophagaceae bacterium]
MRTVKAIYRAHATDYSGLLTYAVIPTGAISLETLEPFIFLNHHGPQNYPSHNHGLPFGPHPHKGFETVTFILEGDVVHMDSTGYNSTIKAGGIQWMTAGKGIIHSEGSSEEFKIDGGPIHILQLWVNLPSRLKNTEPAYKGLQKEDIPIIEEGGGMIKVHIISGSWKNEKGAIQSLTGINLALIYMSLGSETKIEVPKDRQVLCYVIKGGVSVNGEPADINDVVEFDNDDTAILLTTEKESIILFGDGSPSNEPIAAHGPFVMNTMEEIRQAFNDYHNGKFGDVN